MEPVGIFMGICIDLLEKKENKTKYHAKIDIFYKRLRADKIS
jgi:hypothetical protein